MNVFSLRSVAQVGIILTVSAAVGAQTPQQSGTLRIAGQADQATLLRVNGKSYVDVESLARIMHGSIQFNGTQTVLTLPAAATTPTAPSQPEKPRQLSGGFLSAEIEALTQIREWRAALVNAVQNNYPVTDSWVGKLRRSADSKLQLAVAAANTEQDQESLGLLKNEFSNMQQMSDQFLGMQTKVNYISPDSFANNAADQKILSCEQALVSMAATKQFEDEASCH